jgi:hypothetical protein
MLSSPVLDDRILNIAAALSTLPVRSVEQQQGGGNNRLFRVLGADKRLYALKEYPQRTNDGRDRLGAEFAALQFLERCGFANVPKAIAADRAAGFALYEWIDGTPIVDVTDADVDAALALMARLHQFRGAKEATDLALASEACLSLMDIVAQAGQRFDRLNEVARADPRLAKFLSEDYAPVAQNAETWSRLGCEARGIAFDRPIGREGQSLSPSDFGFHNAIRRADGQPAFVDMEYFGWDDPAKLVADFLLHPGMQLSPQQYERFRAGALKIYGGDVTFASRLALVYPLYGLRWCMILLNEFLPERWEARKRAGLRVDRDVVTARQLEKARLRILTVRQYIMDHPQ